MPYSDTPSSYPMVNGEWTGIYTYGEMYGDTVAGTQVPFTIRLTDGAEGHFTGTAVEWENLLDPRHSTVDGHINTERIIFSKEYPVAHYVDAQGTGFSDYTSPGFSILYKGHWHEEMQQFKGSWKIIMTNTSEDNTVSSGTWLMEKGNNEIFREESAEQFIVRYQKEHLLPIYYAGDKGSIALNPRHRTLFIVFMVFMVVGIGSGILSTLDSQPAFVILLTGCILFGFATAIMLGKSITVIRQWKQQIETHVEKLSSVGQLILRVGEEGIIQQTDAARVMVLWKQINEYDFDSNFIYLSSAGGEWIYPKASMEVRDFERLTTVLKRHLEIK